MPKQHKIKPQPIASVVSERQEAMLAGDNFATAAHLATVAPAIHDDTNFDQIDLAIDILRTVHLALRATDWHSDAAISSISNTHTAAVDLIDGAREAMCREASGR